ncbi:autotransporter-associated beta strand repeat-containing protein [Coraliomargarita sp. SDUM461003]|uniref:Autotransporter-associated beta strand repeat-containing protein n=1 Tax=Thalassobacterium maritimum TaxID=3041265 RepID=A0ABU1AXJ6_9BACT|nr:autotransporter-associated beta strand repeat-containing protein [Coraliomargarita sp. SDUM461003]MDQ8208871.1 autotransporter-associated beta strand repeat-containing protein [Coraliomargarita sp. SDUM461003]
MNYSDLNTSALALNPGKTMKIASKVIPTSDLGMGRRLVLASAAMLTLVAAPSMYAQTVYSFDPGLTPATPSGGSGTWDTTSAFWANGGTDFVWANGGADIAAFAGTAGTVTLGGTTINVNAINFDTDGYTVTGGTLNFSGATPSISSGASVSTDLNSTLTGTNGLILAGSGTININNASNSLSGGIRLDSGALGTNTAGSLGNNVITLNGGTFVPRTNLTNDILVTDDSNINISGTGSSYSLGNLSIGNQTLSLVVSSWNNGQVSFGNTTLTGDATIRTNKGSSSTNESSPTAIFNDVTVGDSVATGTTTTLTMTSTGSGVNRTRVLTLDGVLSDNASDATKVLALDVSSGSLGNLIVNVGGANTYTGATTITGRSSGYTSSNATLRLTTANDRLPTGTILTINGGSTNGGILDLNSFNQTVGGLNGGSGAFSGTVTNNDSGSGTATLTVSSTTNDSTFDGLITDGATAKVALTKAGAGTSLTLTGDNTYTGATTVSGGTLAIGAANRIADASALVLNGGSFATNGFSEAMGTLLLSDNSTIDLGSGASDLSFLDSSGEAWASSVTLSILNFDEGVDSVRFGTDAFALTETQLSQITLNGGSAFIDASGYLSAVPEPGSFALIGGFLALGCVVTRRRK